MSPLTRRPHNSCRLAGSPPCPAARWLRCMPRPLPLTPARPTDLQSLADALPGWRAPLLLIAGEQDRTLLASHSQRVQLLIGAVSSRCVVLPRLGHLAHEEAAAVLGPLWPAWQQARTPASPKARGRAAAAAPFSA